jgi:WD40 repeat protein/DNA-binding XRE family transcriptional regulator
MATNNNPMFDAVNSEDDALLKNLRKRIREPKKLTQEDLAKLIGVSDRSIYRWEQGTPPEKPNLEKVTQVFLRLNAFRPEHEFEEAQYLFTHYNYSLNETRFHELREAAQNIDITILNGAKPKAVPELPMHESVLEKEVKREFLPLPEEIYTTPSQIHIPVPVAGVTAKNSNTNKGRLAIIAGIIVIVALVVLSGITFSIFSLLNKPTGLKVTHVQNLGPFKLAVNWVRYSQNGSILMSANGDLAIRAWEIGLDGKSTNEYPLVDLKGHNGYVYSAALNRAGNMLASGSTDKTIRLWEIGANGLLTGKSVGVMNSYTDKLWSLCFNPVNNQLASAGAGGDVVIWDTNTLTQTKILKGHTEMVWELSCSSNGRLLASASKDKTAKIWDAQTGAEILTLSGHISDTNAITFSPDDRLVATSSWDRTIRIWGVASGKQLFKLEGHTDSVYALAFSPDNKLLASGGKDNRIIIWDAVTGAKLAVIDATTMKEAHSSYVVTVTFSPDGQYLASGSEDPEFDLKIWRITRS